MKAHCASSLLLTCTISVCIAQPGTLDTPFGVGGIVMAAPGDLHDVAYDVVALPNNSNLICGVARHNGNNALFIARLREDGGIDPGFGTEQGYTYFNVGEEAYGYAMGVDSQGLIYVCGLAYPTFAQSVIILVRTSDNGIPDSSFGDNGLLTIPVGTHDAEAKGLVIQPDNNILLAGSAVGTDFVRDALLMRVKSDGSIDSDFGVDGYFIADGLGGESLLNDVAILANGAVMGVGYTDVNFAMKSLVLACDINGVALAGFGTNGVLLPAIGANDHPAYGALADGDDLLFTGTVSNATESDVFVAKLMQDGTFDPIFNAGAPVTIDLGDYEVGFDLSIANGQIYVCGTTGQPGFGSPRDFFVAKMNGAAEINAAFGSGGATVTSIQIDFDDANAMTIQPDGKLVLAGFTAGFSTGGDNDVAVVRYWDDGSTVVPEMAVSTAEAVFPNPASGDIVSVRTASTGSIEASILDASGRAVGSTSLSAIAGSITLGISELADGRYVILLRSKGRIERCSFVICR